MGYTTSDLAEFGNRELKMAGELLTAMAEQGLPEDFYDDSNTVIMMNTGSGNVFLTNDEYQVCMMNGDKLEMFYSLSYKGEEGFLEDLIYGFHNGFICEEDYEELADICESAGENEVAEEIRKALR